MRSMGAPRGAAARRIISRGAVRPRRACLSCVRACARQGLEGLIGPPLLIGGSIMASLRHEHTAAPDASDMFWSSNGMQTTSSIEWEVVLSPKPEGEYPEREGFRRAQHG